VRVLSTVSGLPLETAVVQSERAVQRLKESGICAEAENIPVPASRSRGSMCLVVASFERGRAGFAAVGAPDSEPRAVGERAADACVDFIRSHGAVDVALAERLLIPMAAVAARSESDQHRIFHLSTPRLSEGMLSIAALAGCFLDAEVALISGEAGAAEARVAHRREGLLGALAGAARQTER
jgi:RNA 3'-terminal phosphate cyclase